jgi:hypothetical protein
MNFKQTLNEIEDIPITQYNNNPKGGPDRVEPRKQESEGARFTPDNYTLKRGKVSAKSEEELDRKTDDLVEKAQNRMMMVYNYSKVNDTFVAFVVYYDRDVSGLEDKYKNALKNKIETFASEKSKGEANTKVGNKVNQSRAVSNLQKTLMKLSDRSLRDVADYANSLAKREAQKSK